MKKPQASLKCLRKDGNPHSHYPELLALVACGKLRPRSLVTRQVELADVSSVLQNMTDYNTVGFNVITKF